LTSADANTETQAAPAPPGFNGLRSPPGYYLAGPLPSLPMGGAACPQHDVRPLAAGAERGGESRAAPTRNRQFPIILNQFFAHLEILYDFFSLDFSIFFLVAATNSLDSAAPDPPPSAAAPRPPGEYSAPNSTACALCPTGTTIAPHQDTCFPSHSGWGSPSAAVGQWAAQIADQRDGGGRRDTGSVPPSYFRHPQLRNSPLSLNFSSKRRESHNVRGRQGMR